MKIKYLTTQSFLAIVFICLLLACDKNDDELNEVLSPITTNAIRITSANTMEYHPKWHPLHDDSLFYTLRNPQTCNLYICNVNNKNETLLFQNEGDIHFDFIDNGSKIIFDGYNETPGLHILIFDRATKTTSLLKQGAGKPVVSPNGERLLYGGNNGIYTSNIDGSNSRKITTKSIYYEICDWSPDGEQIVMTAEENGNMDLWIVNADGSGMKQITDHSSEDAWPNWSPDGEKIAFASERTGNREIWIMDVNTLQIQQFTNNPASDNHPDWSPDGSKIAFTSDRTGTLDVWIKDYQ